MAEKSIYCFSIIHHIRHQSSFAFEYIIYVWMLYIVPQFDFVLFHSSFSLLSIFHPVAYLTRQSTVIQSHMCYDAWNKSTSVI